ncbi:MAG: FAD-binding oxidoreductase [Candidatus Nomurabacteria bacterium]|jgi:FAD/FMN-containing dehydrogenase|nr:FAD-binding oxidoreductase [Candidatus Nomurabacteria bacterium]
MSKIAKYLNQHILGNVFAKDSDLEMYSTDKSILKIKPQAVVVPKNTQDIRKVMRFVSQLADKGIKLSVTVRGKGNDKTGAAIGDGIVMLTGAMNKVLEIDTKQRLVRVQPGITIDELNNVLSTHGLIVPVAPKHGGHSLGGLIGNNLAGELTGKYGRFIEYVSQIEVVLADGDVVQTERIGKREVNRCKGIQDAEGEIFRRIDNLIDDREKVINEFLTGDDIDNAGYEPIVYVKRKDGTMDLKPLFFAAQGTLGIVSELIVRAEYITERPSLAVIEAPNTDTARDLIDVIVPLAPSQIDFYNSSLFAAAMAEGKRYPLELSGDGKPLSSVVLAVAFDDAAIRTRSRNLKKLRNYAIQADAKVVIATDENYDDVRGVFDVVETYLNLETRGAKLPIVDGAFVPFNLLGEYLAAIKALEKRLNIELPVYGSVLDGIYSIRPGIDLSKLTHRQLAFKLLKEYAGIVDGLDGNMAGDGAEGRIKTLVTRPSTDPQLIDLYKHIKEIFDPKGVLNPGVKSEADLKWLITHLRADYGEGIIKE